MGTDEFGAFLTHLATEWQVSVSTRNQAKSALLVYRQMLGSIELARLGELVPTWMNKRLSVVLTPDEVRAVLDRMMSVYALMPRFLLMLRRTGA